MNINKSTTIVDSSTIHSISWGSDEMTVEFKNGKTYIYYGVLAETYIDLISSDSVGKEFNHLIKKEGYEFELVDNSTPGGYRLMADKTLCPICTSSNLDYYYSDITCGNCGRSSAPGKFFLLPNELDGGHQEGKSYAAQMYMKRLRFGKAIDYLKAGNKVKLPHWQDDVYLELQVPDINSKMTAPYIYVVSRFGLVPWVATQVEMLSEEWVVLG